MTESDEKLEQYLKTIERRLNFPRDVRKRVLDDLRSTIAAKREMGMTCEQIMAGTSAFRIPFEKIERVYAENEMLDYDLPATGGPGIYPLIYTSTAFIAAALVCGLIRKRKREGRSEG